MTPQEMAAALLAGQSTAAPATAAQALGIDDLRASERPMTVLERVERHALGLVDMEPSELQAAKLFLSKTMPDMKAVEVSGRGGAAIPIVLQGLDAAL